jgi:hypothetical protein
LVNVVELVLAAVKCFWMRSAARCDGAEDGKGLVLLCSLKAAPKGAVTSKTAAAMTHTARTGQRSRMIQWANSVTLAG